jgi:hypothetical protein
MGCSRQEGTCRIAQGEVEWAAARRGVLQKVGGGRQGAAAGW